MMIMPQSDRVYHYTDTLHLPFIIQSGKLLPGRNTQGLYPDPDFLWATANDQGDGTQTLYMNENGRRLYREGKVLRVRLQLPKANFFHWSEVGERYPQWTQAQRERLERAAKGHADPKDWWCHDGELPATEVLDIHFKSFTQGWHRPALIGAGGFYELDADTLGVRVGNYVYGARQGLHPSGATMYVPFKIPAAEFGDAA